LDARCPSPDSIISESALKPQARGPIHRAGAQAGLSKELKKIGNEWKISGLLQ
jgi:hypothetical protein